MKRRSSEYAKVLVEEARREHGADLAGRGIGETTVNCRAPGCGRAFIGLSALAEHAEAVHTFDDIRRMVAEEVREQYYKPGNYNSSPPVPGVYAWTEDLSTDWVVFTVEEGGDSTLYKASYSILDRKVTLGEPIEVVRRTVYEPVNKADDE